MFQRSLRRRAPVNGSRKSKPLQTSASPRWRSPPRSSNKSKPRRILKRCSSAPALLLDSFDGDDDQNWSIEGMLFRPQTFSDAFASSPIFSFSPELSGHVMCVMSCWCIQGYKKEAKVVVNVTVEGSPGPVRGMVKLGSSVEDTIKMVVDKYCGEGRTPIIDPNASSSFQLHDSYFSLQSLDKSERIGDVGSRTFYLRKNNGPSSSSSSSALNSSHTQIITDGATENADAASRILPPSFILPTFIARKISEVIRRARIIWSIVFCAQ